MRTFLLLAAVGVASIATAQNFTQLSNASGTFDIHANSFSDPLNLGGLANFSKTGVQGDYVNRMMFAYRQTGDTREYMLADDNPHFTNNDIRWDGVIMRNVNNQGADTLVFAITYILGEDNGAPALAWFVGVQNISAAPIDVSFFTYQDFNVPDIKGNTTSDRVSWHQPLTGGYVEVQQNVDGFNFIGTNTLYWEDATTSFQIGTPFEAMFADNDIDNLNNIWDQGDGDMAIAHQFDFNLQPGQVRYHGTLNAVVANGYVIPEPATWVALLAGVLGLAAFRRR